MVILNGGHGHCCSARENGDHRAPPSFRGRATGSWRSDAEEIDVAGGRALPASPRASSQGRGREGGSNAAGPGPGPWCRLAIHQGGVGVATRHPRIEKAGVQLAPTMYAGGRGGRAGGRLQKPCSDLQSVLVSVPIAWGFPAAWWSHPPGPRRPGRPKRASRIPRPTSPLSTSMRLHSGGAPHGG